MLLGRARKKTVSGKEAASGIVGFAGKDRHLVPAFTQAESEIVDRKILRPEVLRDDQNVQSFRPVLLVERFLKS